ncbi:MAG TPA: DNA alkylation repair protein [Cytophagaceae bacterium]
MTIDQAIIELKSLSVPENLEGMARFGINTEKALAVRIPELRKLARNIKKDHALALQLWETEIHEARILAAYIADPKQVTEELMEQWASDFYSWDLCDQVCGNLFDRIPIAFSKAKEWSGREKEYVKRAGFVLMASLAVHNKEAKDAQFTSFFPFIVEGATDERNFVKKAVNWALRQIGKRNAFLGEKAIALSEKLLTINSRSARWIAKDALRELKSKYK